MWMLNFSGTLAFLYTKSNGEGRIKLVFSAYMCYNLFATQFNILPRQAYLSKNVCLIRHILSRCELCGNRSQSYVFRCVASAAHFFQKEGVCDEETIGIFLVLCHAAFFGCL